jgi:hypothetical protein
MAAVFELHSRRSFPYAYDRVTHFLAKKTSYVRRLRQHEPSTSVSYGKINRLDEDKTWGVLCWLARYGEPVMGESGSAATGIEIVCLEFAKHHGMKFSCSL